MNTIQLTGLCVGTAIWIIWWFWILVFWAINIPAINPLMGILLGATWTFIAIGSPLKQYLDMLFILLDIK